jgi:hypothetical protein
VPTVGQGGIQPPAQNAPGGQSGSRSRQDVLERTLPLAAGQGKLELPPLSGFTATIDLTTAAPSPAPSGASPAPKLAASPSPQPSGTPPAAAGVATPAPTSSSAAKGPHVDTKITAYPDSAPTLPPPTDATPNRSPLVRVLVRPSVALPLYGLAAISFSVPTEEANARRGYSIGVFEQVKHHKERLVTYVNSGTITNGVVRASTARDPLTIPAGHGYSFILYADDLPPTPAPLMSTPPQPATPPVPGQGPPGTSPMPFATAAPGTTYPTPPTVYPTATPTR